MYTRFYIVSFVSISYYATTYIEGNDIADSLVKQGTEM